MNPKKIIMALTLVCAMVLAHANASFAKSTYTGTVNVNTATVSELTLLPGIGASKAQAIVEARSKKEFTKLEELLLVRGIGEALFAKIKPHVTLTGKTTLVKTEE